MVAIIVLFFSIVCVKISRNDGTFFYGFEENKEFMGNNVQNSLFNGNNIENIGTGVS
jgi:hypothetical protein